MAKKDDNTLLLLAAAGVAAYLLLKPKQNMPGGYKTAYLPTSTTPYHAEPANPITSIVTAGVAAVTSIIDAIKSGKNSNNSGGGINTYAPVPVHIDDNIDYENGGMLQTSMIATNVGKPGYEYYTPDTGTVFYDFDEYPQV